MFQKLDVLVDGGIKRGTDVVKALCLGAKGVGIGRAPLWGLAAGGVEGVERTFESKVALLHDTFVFAAHTVLISILSSLPVLSEELKTAMRLLGATKVSDLNLQHVSNLFSKPFSSRFRTIFNDFLSDQYKGSRTANL